MTEEDMIQEFRFKNIEKTNYFTKEIDQNELMSTKNEKVCMILNYIECVFILVFTVSKCISISPFASLVDIPMGFMSSTFGLSICAIIARIKKYKSIIKKKKKKHDEIVLLAKTKLNSIEGLISKALIDSNSSLFRVDLINDVLKM